MRSKRFGLWGFLTGMSGFSDAWNRSYCLAVSRASQTTRLPYFFVVELFPAKTSGSPPPWGILVLGSPLLLF